MLARLTMLLREVAWTTTSPAHHLAVAGQTERMVVTIDRQDFDDVEHGRLHDQVRAVRQALIGRWPTSM